MSVNQLDIREYRESDYPMILSWWEEASEPGPQPGAMVPDGTFVLEIDGVPSMSMTVFLTQSKNIALFEGYIAKSGISKELRNIAGEYLWEHCYDFAADNGYKNVIIYAGKQKLVERYEALGMTASLDGLTAMYREI